ncbi:MAG: phage tail protein [Reyranellaceae bacterium]
MDIVGKRPIFGRGGAGFAKGQGTQPAGRVPSEAPNSLQSRSIARFLDVWCEGEIRGLVAEDQSIYFNDTPLQNADGTFNFTGISWDTRYGLPWGAQSYMAGFPSSRSVVQVGSGLGIKVTHSAPVTVTFTDPSASKSAVIVKLSIPALYDQTNNDGSVKTRTAVYNIYLKTGAGSFVLQVADAFDGKCTSPYQRDHRIALPTATSWQIKVERPGVDIDQSRIKDEFYFTSYTLVTDGKVAHPNVAYCGIQIDTAQFSGSAPTRSYDIYGLKIRYPSNYDPLTRRYAGAWNGTWSVGWTDNPAWCFYDLLINTRYGLGLPASAVDPWKWDLYTIGQYCDAVMASGADMVFQGIDDGNGGVEPRFTCNICLNNRQEAYAAVNTMASIFRGMPFWSSGAVRATADMPKAPVALFTNSNVIGGEFKYEGTSQKARHTIAKVIWNDPADGYRPAAEFVEDPAGIALYGVRQIDIVASGCTSRGQAIRAGKWVLDTERTATETVHFRAGLDMADKFPGDIISIADANYAQTVFGGRTISATTTSLVLDAPYTVVAGRTYTLRVMLPDGTMASRTLTNAPASTSTFTWSAALPAIPLVNAIWAVTATALATRDFMVVSNAEVGPATFEVMGVFYDAAKFARVEAGIVTSSVPYDVVPTGPIGAPVKPSAVLNHYVAGSAIGTSIIVSWSKPSPDDARVYAFDVQVRGPNDAQYVDVGITSMTSIEYQDSVEGVYDFRVRSKSLNGKVSGWAELLAVTLTSQIQPSDVTGLTVLTDTTGVAFKWTPVPDLNVTRYEIRQGASWATGAVVATTTETTFARQGLAVGAYTFWVAAVTAPQGVYSAHPASLTINVTLPGSPSVTGVIEGTDYRLSWPAVTSVLTIDRYEIRYGSSFSAGTPVGTTKATTFQAPVTWAGARLFWIAAIDVSGAISAAVATTVFVSAANAVTGLTAQVIDNNVLLRWTAGPSALPVAYYLVKRGASWAAGTVIGQKQGTFTSASETAGGTFTYWIAAVDSAGNEGAPASVVAAVGTPPDYVLHNEWQSNFAGTKTNLYLDNGLLIGPVSTSETWSSHFSTRGWSTPQDQVNAGYSYFIEPAQVSAQYKETFDFGSTITSDVATVTLNKTDYHGSVGSVVTLETSLNGSSWTTVGTGTQQYVSNFRYVRATVDFTSSGTAFCILSGLSLKLAAKLKTDSGAVAALAADTGGTTVTFSQPFAAVSSITLTPAGMTPLTAVYSFAGGANPTGFKALLFDSGGTRVNGTVSWTARGV